MPGWGGPNACRRFWFGESDQPTAAFISEAAMTSLASGETFYSQNMGRPYLREALSRYLGELHGVPVDAGRDRRRGFGRERADAGGADGDFARVPGRRR